MPKTRESGIHLASPKSHSSNLLTNMFYPMMISKSVNIAENTLSKSDYLNHITYMISKSENVAGLWQSCKEQKTGVTEQLSLPGRGSWRDHWFPCSCSISRSTCKCGGESEALQFFPLSSIITLSRLWFAMARGCEFGAEG